MHNEQTAATLVPLFLSANRISAAFTLGVCRTCDTHVSLSVRSFSVWSLVALRNFLYILLLLSVALRPQKP